MRVTRLEVFGFKSFMERLVLPLEAGITGVVGPNGCGKSNVVDALRWVLGETRAGQLRGGTLEDVIFNGTDQLRPLGLAEVTITLRARTSDIYTDLVESDKEGKAILEELDKVRGEEETASEEGDNVEEREETPDEDPPHLTVLPGGKEDEKDDEPEGDSDAEESQAEEVIESLGTAVDEGLALEETQSMSLLTRFTWLKSVSELQITRRLYRSGESEFFINKVPCRLKDLKDLFRVVGLGARAYTIVAQGEVSRIVTAKPEERRMILEEAAGVLGFRDKIAEANRRLSDTTVNISRLDDVIKELTRQVGSLKRQASRARARQEMKAEIAQIDRTLFKEAVYDFADRSENLLTAQNACKEAETTAAEELEIALEREAECRGELSSVDIRADELRARTDRIKDEINRKARHRAERRAKLNEAKAARTARENEIKRLEEREATLIERKANSLKGVEELEAEDGELSEQAAEAESIDYEEELKSIADQLHDLRQEHRAKDQEVREVRDRLISAQSSLHAVHEQMISASPLTQLEKSIGSEVIKNLPEQVGLFIDGLTIPEKYGKAVQAVLAERARFLLSSEPYSVGRHFVQYLYQRKSSEKRGLGIGVFKMGGEVVEEILPDVPFPRILDNIEVAARCRLAASRVFMHSYFVETVEEALSYFEQQGEAASLSPVVLVTAEGDLVTSHSFYSLRHEGGLIQLKNRERTLAADVEDLKAQQDELVYQREQIFRQIQGCEARHSEILRESHRKQALLRELSKQQGAVRGRLESERRVLDHADQDIEAVRATIEECKARIEELREHELELQIEVDALEEDADDELQAQLEEVNDEAAQFDVTRREGRHKLQTLANEVARLRKSLDQTRAQEAHFSIEIRKLELEQQSLRERLVNEYGGEEYQKLVQEVMSSEEEETQRLDSSLKQELTERISQLRARISREGEVDASSIQQYEEENQRLEGLISQKQDLEKAADILKASIERLTKNSERRFLSTYQSVSSNFSRLIPRLFGGGRGELVLLDPTKPLDSGVDISVRPPGKKPKSIDLLSGGEKALCATALIVSMFLERPSPLCVLDEVDAPLDEANLLRFLGLVKEMSSTTQFLMITHNKRSMAVADNLVGVTMQTPGASRIITVSLKEAEKTVEAA